MVGVTSIDYEKGVAIIDHANGLSFDAAVIDKALDEGGYSLVADHHT